MKDLKDFRIFFEELQSSVESFESKFFMLGLGTEELDIWGLEVAEGYLQNGHLKRKHFQRLNPPKTKHLGWIKDKLLTTFS